MKLMNRFSYCLTRFRMHYMILIDIYVVALELRTGRGCRNIIRCEELEYDRI